MALLREEWEALPRARSWELAAREYEAQGSVLGPGGKSLDVVPAIRIEPGS